MHSKKLKFHAIILAAHVHCDKLRSLSPFIPSHFLLQIPLQQTFAPPTGLQELPEHTVL